jgi:hypothetical protein
MENMMPKVKEVFKTFEEYEKAWHDHVRPKQSPQSMYWDGQFDEFPYIDWEENVEISITLP